MKEEVILPAAEEYPIPTCQVKMESPLQAATPQVICLITNLPADLQHDAVACLNQLATICDLASYTLEVTRV